MEWIKVEDKNPEMLLVNSCTSMSRHYLVYSKETGISFGFMVKYIEGASHWVVGQYEMEAQITHWLDAKEPI